VLDFLKEWPGAVKDLAGWITEGKINTEASETVVSASIEQVPQVWQRLFKGENKGKLVTKIEV
jgi:NADPH-dependent curcumin reductase CurA